jgi:hypothetical protein
MQRFTGPATFALLFRTYRVRLFFQSLTQSLTTPLVLSRMHVVRYLAMGVLYCSVLVYALPTNELFIKNISPLERVYRAVA